VDLRLSVEYKRFVLLQLRRDEAFGIDQSLLANVLFRSLIRTAPANLDVITKDLIKAHFERFDAGTLAFFLL